jgi:hypothetical protein
LALDPRPQDKAKRDAELAEQQLSSDVSRFMIKEGISTGGPKSVAALADEWDLDKANFEGLWEDDIDVSRSSNFD